MRARGERGRLLLEIDLGTVLFVPDRGTSMSAGRVIDVPADLLPNDYQACPGS